MYAHPKNRTRCLAFHKRSKAGQEATTEGKGLYFRHSCIGMLTISNLPSLVGRVKPTAANTEGEVLFRLTPAQKAPPASDLPSKAENPTSTLHYAKAPTTFTLQHNAIDKLFGRGQAGRYIGGIRACLLSFRRWDYRRLTDLAVRRWRPSGR